MCHTYMYNSILGQMKGAFLLDCKQVYRYIFSVLAIPYSTLFTQSTLNELSTCRQEETGRPQTPTATSALMVFMTNCPTNS